MHIFCIALLQPSFTVYLYNSLLLNQQMMWTSVAACEATSYHGGGSHAPFLQCKPVQGEGQVACSLLRPEGLPTQS